jgi:hypothetical protein
MVPSALEEFPEAAAGFLRALGISTTDDTDQVRHRFIGRTRWLLPVGPGFDRLANYFGRGELLAARDARDPLACLFVESQSERGCHGVAARTTVVYYAL